MKNISKIVVPFCFLLMASSLFVCCRDDADEVPLYGIENDGLFIKAGSSFAEQFKAVWMTLNTNYQLWDYEALFGLDWDDVYDKYLPQFEKLDKRDRSIDPVPDSTLKRLYTEILAPLHDGHLSVEVKNLHKQDRVGISIRPSDIRNKGLRTYNFSTLKHSTFFDYYKNEAEGNNCIVEDWSVGLDADVLDYRYSRFADNIIYMSVNAVLLDYFHLSSVFASKIDEGYHYEVRNAWFRWFNMIQELHHRGTLKGIVIDLRNNHGGPPEDNKYILGALLPPTFQDSLIQVGHQRIKNGIGRLDYSPITPFCLNTYPQPHAAITQEPIVVLTSAETASCAELGCLEAKQASNAVVVGERTWGALCAINLPSRHAEENVGKWGETPFWMIIPSCAFFTLDGQILEGIGVMPDIEVAFDEELYQQTGRDTQLERALEYIRSY